MGMILDITAESDLLHVEASGDFSLDEAKRTFLEILGALARQKARKVLMDGRKLEGEPRTMERFYYGEFTAQSVKTFKGVSRDTKFAYVLEVPVRDHHKFGETVATNRGMLVKVFGDPEDARQWLNPIIRKPHTDDSN
jgi:hypothetical protein